VLRAEAMDVVSPQGPSQSAALQAEAWHDAQETGKHYKQQPILRSFAGLDRVQAGLRK
jgi:hypothetical protein